MTNVVAGCDSCILAERLGSVGEIEHLEESTAAGRPPGADRLRRCPRQDVNRLEVCVTTPAGCFVRFADRPTIAIVASCPNLIVVRLSLRSKIDGVGAEPLGTNDGDGAIRERTADEGACVKSSRQVKSATSRSSIPYLGAPIRRAGSACSDI